MPSDPIDQYPDPKDYHYCNYEVIKSSIYSSVGYMGGEMSKITIYIGGNTTPPIGYDDTLENTRITTDNIKYCPDGTYNLVSIGFDGSYVINVPKDPSINLSNAYDIDLGTINIDQIVDYGRGAEYFYPSQSIFTSSLAANIIDDYDTLYYAVGGGDNVVLSNSPQNINTIYTPEHTEDGSPKSDDPQGFEMGMGTSLYKGDPYNPNIYGDQLIERTYGGGGTLYVNFHFNYTLQNFGPIPPLSARVITIPDSIYIETLYGESPIFTNDYTSADYSYLATHERTHYSPQGVVWINKICIEDPVTTTATPTTTTTATPTTVTPNTNIPCPCSKRVPESDRNFQVYTLPKSQLFYSSLISTKPPLNIERFKPIITTLPPIATLPPITTTTTTTTTTTITCNDSCEKLKF